MKNYKKDVGIILDSHLPKMNDFAVLNLSDNFKFFSFTACRSSELWTCPGPGTVEDDK